jgi:hypothetical protein
MKLTTLKRIIRAEISVSEARQAAFKAGAFGVNSRQATHSLLEAEDECKTAWRQALKEAR